MYARVCVCVCTNEPPKKEEKIKESRERRGQPRRTKKTRTGCAGVVFSSTQNCLGFHQKKNDGKRQKTNLCTLSTRRIHSPEHPIYHRSISLTHSLTHHHHHEQKLRGNAGGDAEMCGAVEVLSFSFSFSFSSRKLQLGGRRRE